MSRGDGAMGRARYACVVSRSVFSHVNSPTATSVRRAAAVTTADEAYDAWLCPEVEWKDPATGNAFEAQYAIKFPKKAGRTVKVELTGSGCGTAGAEWTDAVWEQLDDLYFGHTAWLESYCRAHGLRLIHDGEVVDLTEVEAACT